MLPARFLPDGKKNNDWRIFVEQEKMCNFVKNKR